MNAILSNLHDPSWWFTAIFVTILAGVASGFVKETLEKAISSSSSRYRSWTSAQAQARENAVRALAGDPQYLALSYLGVVAGLLMHVLAVIMYFVAMFFLGAGPGDAFAGEARPFTIWKILMPVLGAAATYIGFRTTSRLSLVTKALRLYRRKHGLPKLP